MPDFHLPLSGAVTQTINPWTAFFSPMGNQASLVTVNLGTSSAPAVEGQVLSDVASYGKQLGRIGDVLEVLIAQFRAEREPTPAQDEVFRALTEMLHEVARVKHRHKASRPV